MAENDNPKNSMILAMVIGTVATLVVVVLIIVQFFDIQVRNEVQDKVLSQTSSLLRDLRAQEQSKLSKYVWVDKEKGIVRIPVDHAAELTLRDWDKRPTGLVKVEDPTAAAPAPAAPAAPAPAPAPASPAPAPAAAPPTPDSAHAPPTPGVVTPAPGNPAPTGTKESQSKPEEKGPTK